MNLNKLLSVTCCLFAVAFVQITGQNILESDEDVKMFEPFKKQTPATDEELSLLQELIISKYSKNETNSDFIIRNLDRLSGDRMVTGYRILLGEMINTNKLHNPYTLALMHRTVIGLENPAISDLNKIDLYYMQEKMPRLIRDFPFQEGIYFESRVGKDILATGDFMLPNSERGMFAWNDTCLKDECIWDLEPVAGQTYFRLKNRRYKEYAMMNDKRDTVAVQSSADPTALGWYFYPDKEFQYFSLKNVKVNRIFCRVPHKFKFNGVEISDRRKLFAWHDPTNVVTHWKVMGELEFIQRIASN